MKTARGLWCKFCRCYGEETCANAENAGTTVLCTRDKGHEGKHVVCGMRTHEKMTWK